MKYDAEIKHVKCFARATFCVMLAQLEKGTKWNEQQDATVLSTCFACYGSLYNVIAKR